MNALHRTLALAIVAALLSVPFSGCIGGNQGDAGKAALAASLSANPISGKAPLKVTFEIEGSDASGLKEWKLTYGDGSSDGASVSGGNFSAAKTHTYESAGTFTARLIVTNSAGASDAKTKTISVNNSGGSSTGSSGGSGEPPAPETLVYKPSRQSLSKLDLQGKSRIVLPEGDYACLPVLAPVFKNFGINVSIGWNPGDGADIQGGDASRFSSEIAVTFWEGNCSNAIVVDSYENALLAGPLASIINAPVLYYGTTTNEALWRIGANDSNEIIAVGNVPYAVKTKVSLQSQEKIWECTIAAAKQKGINLNYVAVVNPNDDTSNKFYTSHLSAFGSILAAHRNGLVVSTNGISEKTNAMIKSVADKIECANLNLKFICIIGDYAAVQPGGWITDDSWGESALSDDDNPCPSDNPYADFDDDNATVECANGRIIAKKLSDMSKYIDIMVNYKSYLSNPKKDASPNPVLFGSDWNNNAMTYFATRTEYMTLGAETATNNIFRASSFNTQDDSAQAHCDVENILGITGMLLAPDFAKSNFIAMMSDHGYPGGCSVDAEDLVDMPPNVLFASSCSLGRIDFENYDWAGKPFTKDMSFTFTLLEKGMAAYFGATRTTWGYVGELPDNPIYGYEDQGVGGAQGMGYLLYKHLINGDLTTGEALMNAKNQFISESADSSKELIAWEYQLYGDPAFNPYEPCNEGK